MCVNDVLKHLIFWNGGSSILIAYSASVLNCNEATVLFYICI
jgi:hypothetical protein